MSTSEDQPETAVATSQQQIVIDRCEYESMKRIVDAVNDWTCDRSPRDAGDCNLMIAVWQHQGDWDGCPECDFKCGEPCTPLKAQQAVRNLLIQRERFRAMTRGETLTLEQAEKAIEWMVSRPETVKALMRKFPPACTVLLRKDSPLCEQHRSRLDETFSVQTYLESGRIGVVSDSDDTLIRVDVEHLTEPIAYHNGQDKQWVESVLASGG